MAFRTFAIGDIHGSLQDLELLLSRLPALDAMDTVVFLGDYIDRGPESAKVVEHVRKGFPLSTPAQVVALRGNHEDAWLRVVTHGFYEFVEPPTNGALACLRSYSGGRFPRPEELPTRAEQPILRSGSFFPDEHLAWFESLPHFYEDEHAIYVHAGLPPDKKNGGFLHPSASPDKTYLLWCRDRNFFAKYRGKKVVVGHTATDWLPQELSGYTPEDPMDMWAGPDVFALDTGCGKGGFLTALELPSMKVYESR